MVDALDGFDPQATYDAAAADYEDASHDFWQYLSFRTVERLALKPGERVLDVPCGTGPSLLASAERVGATGGVVGIDYADQMLAIARHKVEASGFGNVEIRKGDMTAISAPEEPYDAVVCVLGVFFVDDMPGLIRSFVDLLQPKGRLAVTVFGEHFFDPMSDVFVKAVEQVAPGFEVVQPWRRTERESTLRGIFDDAGLLGVTIHTDDDTMPIAGADDWWRIVMGSGLRRTVASLGPGLASAVRDTCNRYVDEHGVTGLAVRARYAIASPG